MSVRKPESEPPKRNPRANRHPAPPTATITPEPGEPFDTTDSLKRQARSPNNPNSQQPNTPSKYAQHPGMPVRTSHQNVAITPRNAYDEHDPIPTPHTLLNPLSDVPDQGSIISTVTRTIKDEICVAGPYEGSRTYPNYQRRNIPVPYSSRTEPAYRSHNRKFDDGGWSTATVNGSIVEPRYVHKKGIDPSIYLWLNRHNQLSDWKDAVAERDRYYIETPWSDRRYPGQEPQLSDTDIWAYRNFGKNRDWLDTPYYDGRYYLYDRRYFDYDIGPETRYGLKRHYKTYQSDPGAVNTSLWIRRHYETAPDYTDYDMWKAGQRAKRRNLAKIQKERQRHLARRHGNVFRAPSPYDDRDDLDTIIQPRVKVLPHDEYREPKKPLSMMTIDGSAVVRPRRKLTKKEWQLELLRQQHQRDAKVYKYRHNVQRFREQELVPEWIDTIETPPYRDFRHKSKLLPQYENERQQLLDDERKFSRESDISSVPHPAQTPRVPTRVGEYNTYVGNYDTFNKFDHYYNRRKDGAPLNKYGNNYKSRNMATWYWN